MKFVFSIIGAVFCIGASGAELSLGAPVPEVMATILDSPASFQVSQMHGKTIIVNFWATWCAPCRAEMPILQTYYERHKSDGLEILAISMDDARDIGEVRKIAHQFTFPVAIKSQTNFKGLGRIWRLPTTFVVDRAGILRKNGHLGDAELTQAELDTLVTPLLAKP